MRFLLKSQILLTLIIDFNHIWLIIPIILVIQYHNQVRNSALQGYDKKYSWIISYWHKYLLILYKSLMGQNQ